MAIITCSTMLFACTSKQTIFRENLEPPTDSSTLYFPVKQSRQSLTNNALDSFVNTWYSQMLFALHEPVLMDYTGNKEIYRFTWLRTFHHPVSIRLEEEGNQRRLIVKMTEGEGGYEPGKLIIDKVVTITSLQWKTFLQKISMLNFWNDSAKKDDGRGTDGSEWILEGCRNGQYEAVIRWTPQKEDYPAFRETADYLVKLSTLTIAANEYY